MSERERPILFSGPMVRTILDGRKTQTRRVIKPQPDIVYRLRHCPFKVGQVLWVRQSWRVGAWDENDGTIAVDYRADGSQRREWLMVPNEDDFTRYWQQSTDEAIAAGLLSDENGRFRWLPGDSPCRWRSGRFMPRWASRLTLRVSRVGHEQLREITESDARAEGFENVAEFLAYWDGLNAKRGYGSDMNPWVWVLQFGVEPPPGAGTFRPDGEVMDAP